MKFADGSVGSISLIFLYRVDPLHHDLVLSFVCLPMSCFVADRLVGSSLRSIGGRKLGWLEPRIAAVLASLSTASLPVEPICPATHLNSTSRFVRLSFEVLIASSIRSSLMLRFIPSMRVPNYATGNYFRRPPWAPGRRVCGYSYRCPLDFASNTFVLHDYYGY